MAHTPGPWHVVTRRVTVCIKDEREYYITENVRPLGSEQDDNARLIAAAPELLEALRYLLNNYVRLVGSGDCGNWNPENEDFVRTARAAIAKAEGQS